MAEVLIVDDERDIVEALAELLVGEGHRVWIAYDGVEGLDCLRAKAVDLILLDVDMPRLSGPEMAYQVFLMDVGREKIFVVLLSATPDLAHVASVIGTPYFLAKPFPAEDLFRLMARALVEGKPPAPHWGPSLDEGPRVPAGRG